MNDFDMVMRDIAKVDVSWMLGYANSPSLELHLKVDSFPYFKGVGDGDYNRYTKWATTRGFIFYSDHPMGWVRYFHHCGKPSVNEGGYGGAPFGVYDGDTGEQYILKGPWSSRATVVNRFTPEDMHVMDVTAVLSGGSRISTAMKVTYVKHLLEMTKFEHHIVRAGIDIPDNMEQRPWVPSTSLEYITKLNGQQQEQVRNILYTAK